MCGVNFKHRFYPVDEFYIFTGAMIIYRMVIVEGRCDKLQLLISYIYDHWLTQKYSEFWLVRYNAGYCCYFLLPSYIYDHCLDLIHLIPAAAKTCSDQLSQTYFYNWTLAGAVEDSDLWSSVSKHQWLLLIWSPPALAFKGCWLFELKNKVDLNCC